MPINFASVKDETDSSAEKSERMKDAKENTKCPSKKEKKEIRNKKRCE